LFSILVLPTFPFEWQTASLKQQDQLNDARTWKRNEKAALTALSCEAGYVYLLRLRSLMDFGCTLFQLIGFV
jgi:hypothetical protein